MKRFIIETKNDNITAEEIKEILIHFKVKETLDYERGFNILYEYFDSIADEEKADVNKKLKRIGI